MGASTQHNEKGLTIQELELCRLYCFGGREYAGDQSACYKKVYGSGEKPLTPASLWSIASRKFKLERVKETIKEMTDQLDEMWVKTQLKELASQSQKDSDKIRATELIGKTHAMFTDKVEMDAKIEDILVDYNE